MTLKEDVNEARDRWRESDKALHESREEIARLTKELREVQDDIDDAKQGGDRRAKLRRKEEKLQEKLKAEEREKKALKEMTDRRDKVRDDLVKKLRARQQESQGEPQKGWADAGPDTWGGCRAVIDREVLPVFARYGVPITSRKRTETYGNPTSDHHVSQVMADAVDGGVANAYGIQDKVGEEVGVGDMQDYVNEYFTFEGLRFRIQTIAATHGTGPHLHVGVRRA